MEKQNENVQLAQGGQTTPATFNFFDPVQFETMQRVCKLFASSELVPDMYKTNLALKDGQPVNPEHKAMANCMIAIEISQRIGASPLMIMQNMVPIYGKPSWSSKFLISTVNTCGRFNPLRFKFTEKGPLGLVEYTEYTKTWINGQNGGKGYYKNEAKISTFDGKKIVDIECIAFTTARGSDEILESSPISLRLAIQEGWYLKAGSKWQTMPKQMLMYRSASFWTNVYAPELSMGMKTEDEIRDIVDIDYEDVSEKLEREIKANANKEVVSFDGEKSPDQSPADNAPEGGEPVTSNEQPKEKPKEQTLGPGF